MVGFPAGGPADIFGRTIAQKLTEVTGQQVVVDNRAGAGGIVATENVAKSPADGYSIYLASSAVLSFYANLYDKLPYDLNRDFVPVTLAVTVPEMLVVHPALPVKTAKDFVALAKSKPGQLVYGSTGNGNMPNLAMESFKIAAGVNILHVPYKGAAPAVIDLLGGHVQATILDVPVLLPHVQGGRLRALAIATGKRADDAARRADDGRGRLSVGQRRQLVRHRRRFSDAQGRRRQAARGARHGTAVRPIRNNVSPARARMPFRRRPKNSPPSCATKRSSGARSSRPRASRSISSAGDRHTAMKTCPIPLRCEALGCAVPGPRPAPG